MDIADGKDEDAEHLKHAPQPLGKSMDGINDTLNIDALYYSYIAYMASSKRVALGFIESPDDRAAIDQSDHPRSKDEFTHDLESMPEPRRSRYIRSLTLGYDRDTTWDEVAKRVVNNTITR